MIHTTRGSLLIVAERYRQITVESYTPEHDDEHDKGELVWAARAYAAAYNLPFFHPEDVGWPWDRASWKLTDDPIRNLVKAGALIAAEIDRLLRKEDDEH